MRPSVVVVPMITSLQVEEHADTVAVMPGKVGGDEIVRDLRGFTAFAAGGGANGAHDGAQFIMVNQHPMTLLMILFLADAPLSAPLLVSLL